MTALERNFNTIWQQLRLQQPGRANSLEEITLNGLRGINDLRIRFSFPVMVLAGPNGCGKSTVLFALACAYRNINKTSPLNTPAIIFPDFSPRKLKSQGKPFDDKQHVDIEFSYIANNERLSMKWSKGKGNGKWSRSFFGRKGGSQPERDVYLRTLSNLSNPSEVRSILQLSNRDFKTETIDSSEIAFAQSILGCRYKDLLLNTNNLKSILFAARAKDVFHPEARYSEFHMSAGERSLLRLSMSLSSMNDALVLIDEIEAGLHPYIQQLLMLELHRLSLRNNLQVVVTTHSPVILDTVPEEAKVFLERTETTVIRREPYRDIIQKSLYGHSRDTLSILCEDDASEALIRGVLDYIGPMIDFLQNDIRVGRDTGKDQFPNHLETLGKFQKLGDWIFILDGDARSIELDKRMEAKANKIGQNARVIYLPGNDTPEAWCWNILNEKFAIYSPLLGLTDETMQKQIQKVDNIYNRAPDKPSSISKSKFISFSLENSREPGEIIRLIGKTEASGKSPDMIEFVKQLQDMIGTWRSFSR